MPLVLALAQQLLLLNGSAQIPASCDAEASLGSQHTHKVTAHPHLAVGSQWHTLRIPVQWCQPLTALPHQASCTRSHALCCTQGASGADGVRDDPLQTSGCGWHLHRCKLAPCHTKPLVAALTRFVAVRREPLAVTVSATTPSDQRLWLAPGVAANYGSCVDIWGPGTSILSASNESDTATKLRSGTSQAVPFVAGAAALYLQNTTREPCAAKGL